MAPGDTARLYHRLTSYAPGWDWGSTVEHPLVLQDFVPNDFARWPAPCKSYAEELSTVALPRDWTPEPERLDLGALARLLYLSAGVVRIIEREDRPTLLLRAAGSAGGRFPLEAYVAARGVDGLDDGVHWYDPVAHALRRVAPAPDGEATAVVVTGVPWRTGWRYSERGFRHIYWDAGTMLSQALALAGPDARLWTRFPDAQVTELVGADGVHEFPVAVVGLQAGAPAIAPRGPARAGAVDAAPMEFPLVTKAQRAGDGEALGEPWPLTAAPPAGLDELILRRGSTRIMDRTETVPRAVFERCLAESLADTRQPHFVAVHAVADTEPGLCRWPDIDRPSRAGSLRDELFRVCMEQDLGRDAAFVVMGACDLERLPDDRAYREAQLDAGIVEGRLHLHAFAGGIGASGMTFYDSEIAGLLGEPLAALLFTCVGVPSYRNRRGGRPGEPAAIVYPRKR